MKSMRILLFSIFLCIISLGFGIHELKASSNCTNSIPELFKQVSPSLVFISAASIDPFKVINRLKSAIGSGFIFTKDGLILTNSHVVFGQQLIMVTLEIRAEIPDGANDKTVRDVTENCRTLKFESFGSEET